MRAAKHAMPVLGALVMSGCTLLYGDDFRVAAHDAGPDARADADAVSDADAARDVGVDVDGGTDAGGDACVAPSGAVLGTVRSIHATAAGEITVPLDLTGYSFRAQLEDGTQQTGTLTGPGAFRIDAVPDGVAYVLRVVTAQGVTTYDVTDRRCVDLDVDLGGRPDAVSVTVAQPIELHLTAMQPWRSDDWIVTEVLATSSEGWQVDGLFTPPLTAGATTIDATYDFGAARYNYSYRADQRPALVDGARGDRLQIAHARRTAVLDANGRLHDTFGTVDLLDVAESITMRPGESTRVDGAFTPLTPDHPLRFATNRAAFDAGYSDAQSLYVSTTLGVYGSPVADRGILVGIPLASATLTDWSGPASRSSMFDVTYADPLPTEWPRVYDVRYARRRGYRIPGASSGMGQGVGITRFMALAGSPPSTPDVLPPSGLRVDGAPAAEALRVAFDGSTPVAVSWNPVASSDYYTVQVVRLYADGMRTASASAATLRTRETSVDVPPEVFTGGEYFFFAVGAWRDGGTFAAGHLRRRAYPSSSAITSTGRVRLIASCGDGHVDPGEACDPGATETAACNIDCTTALCGDGVANTAASEACDSVFSTAGCTSDCRAPVCGDGDVAPDREDCDDGDALDDGNGCSATCTRNNVCGDSVLQAAVEECDPPDGATCSANCRFL